MSNTLKAETIILHPKKWWLRDDPFLLQRPIWRSERLVLGRVTGCLPFDPSQLKFAATPWCPNSGELGGSAYWEWVVSIGWIYLELQRITSLKWMDVWWCPPVSHVKIWFIQLIANHLWTDGHQVPGKCWHENCCFTKNIQKKKDCMFEVSTRTRLSP